MSSKFSPFLFLGCFVLSCQNENAANRPTYEQADLVGRWEISKGFRNGKETETLSGTYYEFTADGSMKTNLTPTATEQIYPYNFDSNEIKQKGEPAIVYSIDTLTEDLLTMSMVINNFPFKLELKKAVAPTELEANDSLGQDSLKEL